VGRAVSYAVVVVVLVVSFIIAIPLVSLVSAGLRIEERSIASD
jgi:hypothetical protein